MTEIVWGLRETLDGWACSCGQRLYPECDVSAASVADEFERHLMTRHGVTRDEIQEKLGRRSTPGQRSG